MGLGQLGGKKKTCVIRKACGAGSRIHRTVRRSPSEQVGSKSRPMRWSIPFAKQTLSPKTATPSTRTIINERRRNRRPAARLTSNHPNQRGVATNQTGPSRNTGRTSFNLNNGAMSTANTGRIQPVYLWRSEPDTRRIPPPSDAGINGGAAQSFRPASRTVVSSRRGPAINRRAAGPYTQGGQQSGRAHIGRIAGRTPRTCTGRSYMVNSERSASPATAFTYQHPL